MNMQTTPTYPDHESTVIRSPHEHGIAVAERKQLTRMMLGIAVHEGYTDIEREFGRIPKRVVNRALAHAREYLATVLPERILRHRMYIKNNTDAPPPSSFLIRDYNKQGLVRSHYKILSSDFCVYTYVHDRSKRRLKLPSEYVPAAIAFLLMEIGVPVHLLTPAEDPVKMKGRGVIDIGVPFARTVIANLGDLERIGLNR